MSWVVEGVRALRGLEVRMFSVLWMLFLGLTLIGCVFKQIFEQIFSLKCGGRDPRGIRFFRLIQVEVPFFQ
jgi:hypothetical protein